PRPSKRTCGGSASASIRRSRRTTSAGGTNQALHLAAAACRLSKIHGFGSLTVAKLRRLAWKKRGASMHYDWVAIPDSEVPATTAPPFRHVVETYASETNKTASMWRAVPDHLLDFRPHEKCNTIRTILVHQLLSERRFFAQFVGTQEPPVDQLLPS